MRAREGRKERIVSFLLTYVHEHEIITHARARNAIEAACIQLKRYVGEQHGVGIKEEIFTKLLGWQESKGNKIDSFEFMTRNANNNSDAFNHAYNILKANDATISNRFHDEGYRFGYWLFSGKPNTIYRQTLKNKWENEGTGVDVGLESVLDLSMCAGPPDTLRRRHDD